MFSEFLPNFLFEFVIFLWRSIMSLHLRQWLTSSRAWHALWWWRLHRAQQFAFFLMKTKDGNQHRNTNMLFLLYCFWGCCWVRRFLSCVCCLSCLASSFCCLSFLDVFFIFVLFRFLFKKHLFMFVCSLCFCFFFSLCGNLSCRLQKICVVYWTHSICFRETVFCGDMNRFFNLRNAAWVLSAYQFKFYSLFLAAFRLTVSSSILLVFSILRVMSGGVTYWQYVASNLIYFI